MKARDIQVGGIYAMVACGSSYYYLVEEKGISRRPGGRAGSVLVRGFHADGSMNERPHRMETRKLHYQPDQEELLQWRADCWAWKQKREA